MSALAVQWAKAWRPARHVRNDAELRLTVLYLAEHADHAHFITDTSNRAIAGELERCIRSVQRYTAELIAQGTLLSQNRFVKGLGQVANVYRLLTDAVRAELAQRTRWTQVEAEIRGDRYLARCQTCGKRMLDHTLIAGGEVRCPP